MTVNTEDNELFLQDEFIFLKPHSYRSSEFAGNKNITLSGKQSICHILEEVVLLNISQSKLLFKVALKINSHEVSQFKFITYTSFSTSCFCSLNGEKKLILQIQVSIKEVKLTNVTM